MTRIEQCYRGVVYRRTIKGVWIFDTSLPGGNYWDRYFTNEEIKKLYDSTIPVKEQQSIVETAVDRMLVKYPTYTGDLRLGRSYEVGL